MDPDQTLTDLLEQLADGDGSGAVGSCESLAAWLDSGGAVPQAAARRALRAMTTCEAINRDDALARIAKEELGVETLEPRNSDRLDFHDVGVWGLRKALALAWARGYEIAIRAAGVPGAALMACKALDEYSHNFYEDLPADLLTIVDQARAAYERAAKEPPAPPSRAVCPRCGADFTIHKID